TWVLRGLVPQGSDGKWDARELTARLDELTSRGFGESSEREHHKIPNIHRVTKRLSDERRTFHFYRRGIPGRLPGRSGSPEFMFALIEKERALAKSDQSVEQQRRSTSGRPSIRKPERRSEKLVRIGFQLLTLDEAADCLRRTPRWLSSFVSSHLVGLDGR